MDSRQQYIRKKAKKAKINNGFVINGVKVQFGENPNFDVEEFLKNKFKKLPDNLINSVNKIIFGGFYLSPKHVGKSVNDVVYLSNRLDQDDLYSDLIHELAHAYTTKNHERVFGGGELKKEFLSKRNKLYHKMRSSGINLPPHQFFENPNFDRKFDGYLNKTVGYDLLSQIISGIFPTCYSVSSLEEYFAVGLELMFTGKGKMLEDCPVLKEKVEI
tara:strand:- start:2085 stop:2732 length:648 start_codon:yes stop_codon:yes gene_type:complete